MISGEKWMFRWRSGVPSSSSSMPAPYRVVGGPDLFGLPDVGEVSRVPRRRERAITRTDYQQGRPGNHRPGAAGDGWIGDREGGAATEARLLAVEAEDGLAVHRDVQLLLPARPLVVLLDKDLVGVGRDEEVHPEVSIPR